MQESATTAAAAALRYCDGALHRELCVAAVAAVPDAGNKTLPEVISAVLGRAAAAVRAAAANCSAYLRSDARRGGGGLLGPRQRLALSDCLELFDHTLDELAAAAAALPAGEFSGDVSDIQTVLSGALTNQYTCLDGFAYGGGDSGVRVRPYIQGRLYHVAHLLSNSLAMVTKLPRRRQRRHRRPAREAFEGYGTFSGKFPKWVSAGDRRWLQTALAPAPAPAATPAPAPGANSTMQADLVVAKDGSGNFTTVGDAVAAAPNNSAARFVIYIKAGGYFENVEVGKSKTNIMFVGDGIGKTVIKAGRNVVDGSTTFRSATVAVVGNGFIARDLTIENSAGPSKHQAVALRTGADLSVFYRCSFVGYQDTLYVHSLRQFYRECDIYGTVDFIFGDGAVVLQSCNLYARKPDPNQNNVFTAQGREDPNQNTGISIHKCKVAAAADLIPVQSNFSTYLGRPWKQYSRTVYMQSFLDSLIDPAGWLPWNGTFALDTLYYGEYMNRGPGSNTTGRVQWPGHRVINSSDEATNFTVASFIQGDQWLGSVSIPFILGLN
ncbi:Pectinesterase/pectinesterase inhibitor U1 [Ananas comosus]|uniref:Pectinesterase n=1 Tax=Ananas comosus TaxID=4615 RepID=A0A199VL34_ANACO|nr:Pectinesterase/pectinesterase inhibitor U1 [Ananas comosus]